jgi:hypothetical protein
MQRLVIGYTIGKLGSPPDTLRRMIVRDLDANVTQRAAREKSKGTYAV